MVKKYGRVLPISQPQKRRKLLSTRNLLDEEERSLENWSYEVRHLREWNDVNSTTRHKQPEAVSYAFKLTAGTNRDD